MTLLEFANYLSQNYSASDDVNVGELLEAIYRVEGRPLVLPLSVRAKSEAARPLHQCKTLEDIRQCPICSIP